MRAILLIIFASLWLVTRPALARNGETGILVYIEKYEIIPEPLQEGYILILCSHDLNRISDLIEQGFNTKIFLQGYGVFKVEETSEGNFRLYKANVQINSRECRP
ncbi:MAG: hypothetical protein NTX25_15835 [Proteobacteria bacterium]|nr:hypothetical protein [Pseudomonadota bacterium]